jgi:hypothetical protein
MPDSTGLPLRAGVMVLLFLGVLFLLLGMERVGSGASSSEQATPIVPTTTSSKATTATTPAPARPEVFVYNLTSEDGLAATVAQQLSRQQWKAEAKREPPLQLTDVTTTTVFYTEGVAGQKEAAEQVAEVLKDRNAVVSPRVEGLPDVGTTLIVALTG